MLKKSFTKREEILLVILAVLATVSLYYYVFYQPLETYRLELTERMEIAETTITIEQARLVRLEQMRAQLEAAEESGKGAPIPTFDNVQQVISHLNDVLYATKEYSLSFRPTVAEGDRVTRTVQMSFLCNSYAQAKQTVQQLKEGPYRCAITDLSLGATTGRGETVSLSGSPVSVSLTLHYYESLGNGA